MQAVSEAVAAIIDTNAAVQTITGRSTKNIVRYKPRDRRTPPIIAYLATEATRRGGIGRNWDVTVVLEAEAVGNAASSLSAAAQANALLAAAVESLTVQSFTTAGIDAVVLELPDFSNFSDDGTDPSTNPAAVRAEAEITVWITLP
jgi:hypothetical protein